jgi:excisionase family DNA binding protein
MTHVSAKRLADERPYTPETLAERWGCSAAHVRKMIRKGDLPAFTIGGKLLRIAVAEVERYECRGENSDSRDTGAGSRPSMSTTQALDDAARSARMIATAQRQPLPNSNGDSAPPPKERERARSA